MLLRFPLVRLTFCIVLGMVIAGMFVPRAQMLYISIALLVMLTLLLVFRKLSWFGSLLIYPLFVCIGLSAALLDIEHLRPSHYTNLLPDDSQQTMLLVTLSKRLKNGKNTLKYVAEVQKVDGKDTSGKILLNIQGNNNEKLKIGSQMLVSSIIPHNQTPPNPGQFDYNKFLMRKNIYRQIYLTSDNYRLTGTVRKDMFHFADLTRSRIISRLRQHNFNEEDLQVINALVLGQQQELSREISTSYQNAGAVHILSVSGLHVGLILLFINGALRLLRIFRHNGWFRLLIILVSLWTYAFIAGLSPSVVRSCTMFSLLAIGMTINRQTNIFHTLISSMMLILLVEPEFLYEVGFQLSYLAVAGILWFQPMFNKIWSPKNRLIKYGWDIFAVSLAAQIGTLPLCLYYFHQFPGLFIITNLLVIPLVTIIMFVGLLLLTGLAIGISHPVPIKLLENLVHALNGIVRNIGSHENFVFKQIPFDFNMMLISFVVIITAGTMIARYNFKYAAAFLISIICFQAILLNNFQKALSAQKLIVLHQHKASAVAVCDFGVAKFYLKGSIPNLKTAIESFTTDRFLTSAKEDTLPQLLFFKDQKILILDNTFPAVKVNPDILLVTSSARLNLDRFLHHNKPQVVIADGSNYRSVVERWRTTCHKRKIPFHYTGEKGFYVLD